MELSIKQVVGAIIGIIVCFLGINALQDNLKSQGQEAKERANVSYTDYSVNLNASGLTAQKNKKPKVNQTIYHLKKGDYSKFDYTSLEAFDHNGNPISSYRISCDGIINGKQEGVYILRYIITDGENYLSCKIAVIIEGVDSNELIYNYKGGISS